VGSPQYPIFDGSNLWVAAGPNAVQVVRATTGVVVATLTGNGLANPYFLAFDGERVLVTNYGGGSVSAWRAADLSPLGSFPTGSGSLPYGVASDGINFWVVLSGTRQLARF
jgi:DNA-binding beta-propeller fold protein YncE